MLDPATSPALALPPDDELIGDLCSVHKKDQSDGKIIAESKKEIRARIGRSTDRGDSVVMALWAASGGWAEAYGTTGSCAKCERMFRPDLPDGSLRKNCPHCKAPLEEPEDEAA